MVVVVVLLASAVVGGRLAGGDDRVVGRGPVSETRTTASSGRVGFRPRPGYTLARRSAVRRSSGRRWGGRPPKGGKGSRIGQRPPPWAPWAVSSSGSQRTRRVSSRKMRSKWCSRGHGGVSGLPACGSCERSPDRRQNTCRTRPTCWFTCLRVHPRQTIRWGRRSGRAGRTKRPGCGITVRTPPPDGKKSASAEGLRRVGSPRG